MLAIIEGNGEGDHENSEVSPSPPVNHEDTTSSEANGESQEAVYELMIIEEKEIRSPKAANSSKITEEDKEEKETDVESSEAAILMPAFNEPNIVEENEKEVLVM